MRGWAGTILKPLTHLWVANRFSHTCLVEIQPHMSGRSRFELVRSMLLYVHRDRDGERRMASHLDFHTAPEL